MNKKLTLLILLVISSLLFSQDIEIIDAEKIKNMKPRAKKRLLGKNLVISVAHKWGQSKKLNRGRLWWSACWL